MSDAWLTAEEHEETLMLMIYGPAESLVPERMERGEWLPADAEARVAKIRHRLRGALAQCAASPDPAAAGSHPE